MLKRIFTNLFLIFIVLAIIEFFCFITVKQENKIFKQNADKVESNKTRNYATKYTILKDFNPTVYRPSVVIKNTDKKPIILFGCSFAEGAGLEDENTPCAKLSQLTGRSCINKSKGATGMQFMYYQLLNKNFYKETPEADYVIYIYIHNHIQRLYNYQVNPLIDMFNLRYEIAGCDTGLDKNNKIVEIKPIFKPLYSSYAIKRFLNKKVYLQAQKEQSDFKLFNSIMKENVKLIKQNYKNAKIIMLEYPEIDNNPLPDFEVENLKNMGITVVKVTDLTSDIDIFDKKYWLNDNIHPNNDAWDIILPRLVKQYI